MPGPKESKWDMEQQKCLATMIYGEARGETFDGKIAVAFTALNRASKKTVCEIVLAPKQYSVFNGNTRLKRVAKDIEALPVFLNSIERKAWDKSVKAARIVFHRKMDDPTNGATHYLAPLAMKELGYKYPKWSREYERVAVVDNHVFYKK
jgi:spore germination cell wall hydrolase CwlJ-like protein